MDDDDDIRAALARAHEPGPPFETTLRARAPRGRTAAAVTALALAGAVAVVVGMRPWRSPSSPPAPPDAEVALDLSSPALSSTSLEMPLDSLLEVPALAALGTTPKLVTGGLP